MCSEPRSRRSHCNETRELNHCNALALHTRLRYTLGMTMIGYGRCSTTEQNVDDQVKRLTDAGCVKVFTDVGVSGKLAHRPEWDACLAYLREGDVLAIVKLDRAGRSLQHLIELANELRKRGIGLRVLDQGIDTTTAAGRLFYNMIASFAEFERDIIVERTHEGLRTAKANGKVGGRKPKLSAKQQAEVRRMHEAGRTVVDIAEMFSVSRPAIYRILEVSDRQQEIDANRTNFERREQIKRDEQAAVNATVGTKTDRTPEETAKLRARLEEQLDSLWDR
jgi:DNA invertase Pin-like site-specific DNA recombinase